jgi:hypothetical protein
MLIIVKSSPPVPILSQMNKIHIFQSCFPEIWGDDSDDGGSKHPWNITKLLTDYKMQQPRR